MRMGICGSVAHGKQTEHSDVDICVKMKKQICFYLLM
ncbi:MAG: nucleotidyltransferase domain-containing protein [Bacteroidales bacterium]|nr:nucleotidyltransferase domain-containing protein [Bacteroidales bacterium]